MVLLVALQGRLGGMASSATIDGGIAGGRQLPSARRSDNRFKWLLVTPAALLILAISIYPLLFSIWVLFVNYDFQIPGHAYVGLKNFKQVIFDPVARYSLWITVALVGHQRGGRVPSRPRDRHGDGAHASGGAAF